MNQPPVPGPPAPAWVGVSRLILIKLGPAATARDVEHAPPLGSRADVERVLAELLPGTTFDEGGWGQFTRADYAVTFELGSDEQVRTAAISVRGQPAVLAVRRLLRKTGWRLFAPHEGRFVEPETLGSLMASAPAGGTPEPLQVRTEAPPPVAAWSHTSAAGSRYILLGIVLLAILAWGIWSSLPPRDEALASEQQVMHELSAVGRSNSAAERLVGAYLAPEQLADPANAAHLGAAALPPLFATPVRHGYRFEFQGEPGLIDSEAPFRVEPRFESYVYSAVPVDPQSKARSFAVVGPYYCIYAASGRVPTDQDQLVRCQ